MVRVVKKGRCKCDGNLENLVLSMVGSWGANLHGRIGLRLRTAW